MCVCVWYSHLAALAEAAQQQSSVGGNNTILHMLACMLQSYSKHKGERKKDSQLQKHTLPRLEERISNSHGRNCWTDSHSGWKHLCELDFIAVIHCSVTQQAVPWLKHSVKIVIAPISPSCATVLIGGCIQRNRKTVKNKGRHFWTCDSTIWTSAMQCMSCFTANPSFHHWHIKMTIY